MKAQHRRSNYTVYATSGNLAIAPTVKPEFTLIEGGLHHNNDRVERQTAQRQGRRSLELQNNSMRFKSLFAILFVAVSLLVASFTSDAIIANHKKQAFASAPTTTITVSSGDCLWTIAESHPVAGVSTRDVSRWIMQNNQLENATIYVGQSLVVPASASC